MNLLIYSLAAIICYMGLFAGFILAKIAREEIKSGARYFVFIQKAIWILIFITLMVYLDLTYLLLLLILAFIFVFLTNKKEFFNSPYAYIFLAAIFYISSRKTEIFITASSLIFLYGLPTGTLITKKNNKETVFNILKQLIFLFIAIVLFIIF
jgi:hypothetical protein